MTDFVQTLIAKQEISEVIYRYCHAIDDNDRSRLRSVWHADGLADYGVLFDGTADGFVDWVLQAHAAATGLSHQVTNILIDVDGSGERATSVSYVTALIRTPGTDIVARTRYEDTWSRRGGTWAIDRRRSPEPLLQLLPNDVAPV